MSVVPRSEEELKTIFVSSCIESVVNHLGCPASVMYARMQKIDYFRNGVGAIGFSSSQQSDLPYQSKID